jgi:hypothetical protein
MQRLKLPNGSENMISRPHKNQKILRLKLSAVPLIAADGSTIMIHIAVEEHEEIRRPWLALYYYRDSPKGAREIMMDTLHIVSEYAVDNRPFYWSEFEAFTGQTRVEVKKRLKHFRIDTRTVDRVFPKKGGG